MLVLALGVMKIRRVYVYRRWWEGAKLDPFSEVVMMFQNGPGIGVEKMIAPQTGSARVEVERHLAQSSIRVIDIDLKRPIETTLYEAGVYRLDLSLAPRRATTRGRYLQHWGPERFAQIGKIFLVPPGEALCLRSEVGKDRALVCRLQADRLLKLAGKELTWGGHNSKQTSIFEASA